MTGVSEKDMQDALLVCSRAIAFHENGHLLIPTFERIESELARIAANDNVKQRALNMLKQSKGRKVA